MGDYRGKVSEKLVFNNEYWLLHVELLEPHRIEFKSGQNVTIEVEGEEKVFAITTTAVTNHALKLLVRVKEGEKSHPFLKALSIGQEVMFRGPVGSFYVSDNGLEEKMVFVAQGVGIGPVRAMIEELLIDKNSAKEIKLYWGLKKVEEMFWEEDLYQLSKDHTNFKFDMVLEFPPENGWKLSVGHVTDLIEVYEKDVQKCGYYVCGNGDMVKEVRGVLEDKGVDSEMIHEEIYSEYV